MSHVFARAIGRDLPIVERGEGAFVWDSAGTRYIDAAGGAVVVGIGHGDKAVVEALAQQGLVVLEERRAGDVLGQAAS
jgi:4-aminobutyrate aminotransferase-like enzyme